MSNLVDRLNNEHPNYSDSIAAADKIQELQIDLNILKRGYHVLVQERDRLRAENLKLREVLEKLARLGNGDQYGNSIGNEIARAALENTNEG